MKDFIQRNKALVGAGSAVGVLVVAFLAFGVFGIHTAFTDKEVSEAGPFFANNEGVDQPITTTAPESTADQPAVESPEGESTAEESTPAEASGESEITTVVSGSFIDSAIHAGTGDVNVLTDGNQTFLRFEENFETDNGPDLNVYLRANDGSGEFVDLGDLKGNIGSQNYEIPAGTDLGRFTEIDIWCVRFGVSFTTTQLA